MCVVAGLELYERPICEPMFLLIHFEANPENKKQFLSLSQWKQRVIFSKNSEEFPSSILDSFYHYLTFRWCVCNFREREREREMCIAVFLWQSHPIYPFLLFLNRDEYHNRSTEALRWWEDGETLGGRDLVGGGTWLGCTKHGRLAFLTNFRESSTLSVAKSRGDLPLRFLQSQKSPAEFTEEIKEEIALYNGFNLVIAHVLSKSMIYITNRGDKLVSEVSPGIHVLSNANLDSPWPKCVRLRESFKQLLAENEDGEFPVKTMVKEVMTNTVKDEETELPHVYTPDIEYHLSSIFVDIQRPEAGRYGTRSISAISIKSHGEVCFYERHLEESDSWKDNTQQFVIQNQSI